jgi:hypothetical protein
LKVGSGRKTTICGRPVCATAETTDDSLSHVRSLPFPETLGPYPQRGWLHALRGDDQTGSERYLASLARTSFLTLWSYPNVYTDEGRGAGKGDGKELCDLLVVFGSHVILFSDKDCEYRSHPDPKVAWARWYRRSIASSARQLSGARSWIERFPDRLFLDRQCRHPLPIKLPDKDHLKVHLVAVARGAVASAVEHWKTVAERLGRSSGLTVGPPGHSSGSLMLCTEIERDQHLDRPFQIGWPLGRDQCVHVFDDETLDVVVGVLDTVPDFVRYLDKKEELLRRPVELLVSGEEDLLAMYLSSTRSGNQEPSFPPISEGELVVLREGAWKELVADRSFRARERANRVSYHWDTLIEFQTSHLIAGSAHTFDGDYAAAPMERVLRKMAEETRLVRRTLGAAVHRARSINRSGKRYTCTVFGPGVNGRAYVILTLPKPKDMSYEDYVEHRRYQLATYCEGCVANVPGIKEVLGIALEPYATKTISVDYMLLTLRREEQWVAAVPALLKRLEQENMWRASEMTARRVVSQELPRTRPLTESVAEAAATLFRKAKRTRG